MIPPAGFISNRIFSASRFLVTPGPTLSGVAQVTRAKISLGDIRLGLSSEGESKAASPNPRLKIAHVPADAFVRQGLDFVFLGIR